MKGSWKRRKVSELCDLIVDCVNKTAPVVSFNTPYKMIRTSNIKNGRINLDGCRFVDKDTFEKWTRRAKVLKGDVLITREAPMGEVGYVNYNTETFLGQRVVQYRVNPDQLDSRFLLYTFLSPDLQFQFGRYNNGGSIVSHICVPDCFEFEINTPALPIQKKIASVLSALDDKIELNNRINAELEQMAKTLYNYWFVQFDFPNEEGKPYKASGGKMVYDEVLKWEIPVGWEVGTIHNVGHLLGGGTPRKDNSEFWNGTIPFFTPRDFENSFFTIETEGFITKMGLDNCSSRLYPKGTIFITARGTVGNINIASNEMAMNQSCYAVLPKPDINYYFLHQYCVDLIQYMKVKAAGSVFDALVSNDFKLTNAVVPTKNMIDLFGQKSQSFYEKILINRKQNQQLSSLRDWLLPMLMNGQVRVQKTFEDVNQELGMAAEPVVAYGDNVNIKI